MARTAFQNVGTLDRALRAILGTAMVLMALSCPWAIAQGPFFIWGIGILGAVFLLTAATGSCPIYRLLGLRS
ncbi:YgaP family membrane protein [Pontivivens ytuae]|uniref:DUF2892 domain-containing protein n=1 Tax=Pontivivens ytuae TaxID=2789856 RepID=A0A7S9QCX9_9RHOB|nr:DUF2892 domain-containing protein [Pontivivens ytuae]QPH53556.1 DUF2892 domain-containing protein [Pontivivens ytuae]